MKIQSINPATGRNIAAYELENAAAAKGRLAQCVKAQQEWRERPAAERAKKVRKLAEVLRERTEECARLATLEMGKPISQARAEVQKCAALCDYYAGNGPRFLEPLHIETESKKTYIRYDPLGVILGIMPWNFPFWQVIRFAAPTLIAGNGVALKHASSVPGCSLKLQELFEEAGFPKNLFISLLIDGKTADEVIGTDFIAAVSLTGSTAAGSVVAQTAGKYIKKTLLELGGSDPFIILNDADIGFACENAVKARMINSGQSCIAAKRFLIDRRILPECEKRLAELVRALHPGDPLEEKCAIGPLARVEFVDAVEKQVRDSVQKGARLLAGGHRCAGPGAFYEPTLLADVKAGMATYEEEVFGPVMSLIAFTTEEEAVAIANSSEYGLGASIWTRDIERGEKLAERIQSGAVMINKIVASDPRVPFGGIKKSGYGRELGELGIREFVNAKTVMVDSSP